MPLEHDELMRRISRDIADGYDEELEMEIEDRHPLPGGFDARRWGGGEGLPAGLFHSAVSPSGRAREAAGLGGRNAAKRF